MAAGQSNAAERGQAVIKDVHLDPQLPEAEFHRAVKNVCLKLLKDWEGYDEASLVVTSVTGGITNSLLKVAPTKDGNADDKAAVVVRVFGDSTEFIIDRDEEQKVLHYLSQNARFGATILGAFANGRIESFIPAKTLKVADLSQPDVAAAIASLLHDFHALDIPGSKEPRLWHVIEKWLDIASGLSFEDAEKQRQFEEAGLKEMKRECKEMKRVCESLDAPVAFCHQDLLSGNFMIDEKGDYILIDFEYSMYSYRGYDIANHFCEYAGFDCEYELYPDREAQYHFFRHYLKPSKPEEVQEAALESLYLEVDCFSLVAHLFWAVWALIQAKYSPIDFDYVGYNKLRMAEYYRRKPAVLTLVQGGMGD